MLRVSPVSGVIEPYGSTTLHVTFKPFALDGVRGFKAQPVSPQQQVQPFDGLLQVSLLLAAPCHSPFGSLPIVAAWVFSCCWVAVSQLKQLLLWWMQENTLEVYSALWQLRD